MNPSQIEHLDPNKLTLHSAVKSLPALSANAFAALRTSIGLHGIQQPLTVTPDLRVLDGRHRLLVAIDLSLESVPALVVENADPLGFILESALCARRITKSGAALILWESHPEIRARHGLRTGNPNPLPRGQFSTVVPGQRLKTEPEKPLPEPDASLHELAKRYDVPADYFSRLHRMAEVSSQEEWTEMKRKIFNEEGSITRLYAGATGGVKVKGTKKMPTNYDKLTMRAIGSLRTLFKGWRHLSPAPRKNFIVQWRQLLQKVPPELL